MKENVVKLLEKAWDNFTAYYDKKAQRYSKSLNNFEEAKEEHWICWNETDLMAQLARFFYKELDDDNNNDIEMHFNKNISPGNFGKYEFSNKLKNLKNALGRYPKVDLIITQEDNFGSFLLCAEAKYPHYSLESRGRTIEEDIKKDLKTLSEIKKLDIAENVVFIMFDDYYYIHEHERNKSKKIKEVLGIYGNKSNVNGKIKILYHESKAKIECWKK